MFFMSSQEHCIVQGIDRPVEYFIRILASRPTACRRGLFDKSINLWDLQSKKPSVVLNAQYDPVYSDDA